MRYIVFVFTISTIICPQLRAGELKIVMHNLGKNGLTQLNANRRNSMAEQQSGRDPESEIVTIDVYRTDPDSIDQGGFERTIPEIKDGKATLSFSETTAVNLEFFRSDGTTNVLKGVLVPGVGTKEIHVVVPLPKKVCPTVCPPVCNEPRNSYCYPVPFVYSHPSCRIPQRWYRRCDD